MSLYSSSSILSISSCVVAFKFENMTAAPLRSLRVIDTCLVYWDNRWTNKWKLRPDSLLTSSKPVIDFCWQWQFVVVLWKCKSAFVDADSYGKYLAGDLPWRWQLPGCRGNYVDHMIQGTDDLKMLDGWLVLLMLSQIFFFFWGGVLLYLLL